MDSLGIQHWKRKRVGKQDKEWKVRSGNRKLVPKSLEEISGCKQDFTSRSLVLDDMVVCGVGSVASFQGVALKGQIFSQWTTGSLQIFPRFYTQNTLRGRGLHQ